MYRNWHTGAACLLWTRIRICLRPQVLFALALIQTPGTDAYQEFNEVVVSARRPAVEHITSVRRIAAEDITVRGAHPPPAGTGRCD